MGPNDGELGKDLEEILAKETRRIEKKIGRSLRPLQQKEELLLSQAQSTDTLIPTTANHLLEALTSSYFATRVNAGINRLRLHDAEAAIIILTDGTEIVFAPLNLGTSHRDPSGRTVRVAGVDTTPHLSKDWEKAHPGSRKNYRIMAAFHFHPSEVGFSNHDIEAHEEDAIGLSEKRFPYRFGKDFTEGVLCPRWIGLKDRSSTYSLEQLAEFNVLRLLMYSGTPTDTEYQTERFANLTLDRQAEVLRNNGMKANLIDLPVVDDKVNLSPIASSLK